jgi:hypothetical protein
MPRNAQRRSAVGFVVAWCGLALLWTLPFSAARASEEGLRVAAFVADITPPLNEPLVGGLCRPVATIEHRLLAKGVVLRDAGGTYVLCSLDLCALCNGSYERYREAIAEAAGTSASHVDLHEVQQHTASLIDIDAQQLLERQEKPPTICTAQYLDAAMRSTASAVRQAMQQLRPATHVRMIAWPPRGGSACLTAGSSLA